MTLYVVCHWRTVPRHRAPPCRAVPCRAVPCRAEQNPPSHPEVITLASSSFTKASVECCAVKARELELLAIHARARLGGHAACGMAHTHTHTHMHAHAHAHTVQMEQH